MLETLPAEILFQIIQRVNLKDVCSLAITCVKLSQVTVDDSIWYQFIDKHFFKRERYSQQVDQFLYQFVESTSWKTCYRFLFKTQNFRPAFFWDDARAGMGSEKKLTCNDKVNASELAKHLVQAFVDETTNFDCYRDEVWRVTQRQFRILAIVFNTIMDSNLSKLFKTLIQIGIGPYQVTSNNLRIVYTTENLKEFCFLRHHDEILRQYDVGQDIRRRDFDVKTKAFIEKVAKGKQHNLKNYDQIFQAPQDKVEVAVLRVFVAFFKHTKISTSTLSKIEILLNNSFVSKRWSPQSQAFRVYILNLVKLSAARNQETRYKENETESKNIRNHLMDLTISEEILALELTHSDQLNLMSYKLNEYVDCVLLDKKRKEDELLRFLDILDDDKLEVRKLVQLQDINLPTVILKYFEQKPVANKLKKIQRLIDVSERLYEMKNFFSMRDIMQGVRGALSWNSKTELSWGDVDFNHLKKFVRLEEVVEATKDYRKYKEQLSATDTHCIPLLVVHLKEILKEDADMKNVTMKTLSGPDRHWYYTIPRETETVIEPLAKLYHYFARK